MPHELLSTTPRSTTRASPAGDRPDRRAWRASLLLGLIATLISAAGDGVPSIWYDEAVSVGAATRTWPALLGLLAHVDAVHGVYYALLHLWFQLIPYSPFTLRLPSALAVGGCVAVVTTVGRRLAGPRTGIAAGLVAMLMPSLTWAGGEGRSYAITALLASAATAALVRAIDNPSRPRLAWLAYGALLALAGAVFVDSLLLVPAHLVTVALWRGRDPRPRRHRTAAVVSAGAAVLATAPVVIAAAGESAQVAWIDPLSPATVVGVAVNQWFTADPLYALLAIGILVTAATRLIRRRMRAARAAARPAAAAPGAGMSRRLLVVALPWATVPTGLLLLASLTGHSWYVSRYLTFTAPAVALLLGAVFARLRPRLAIGLLVALSLLAVPALIGSRLPHAKQQSYFADAADVVATARVGESATSHDGMLYEPLAAHATATTAIVALTYPAAFAGTTDLTATRPLSRATELWQPRVDLATVTARLDRYDVIWQLTDTSARADPTITPQLTAAGFVAHAEAIRGTLALVRWTRSR